MDGVCGVGGAVFGLLGALVAKLRRDLGRLLGIPSIAVLGARPNERVWLTERERAVVAEVEFIAEYVALWKEAW